MPGCALQTTRPDPDAVTLALLYPTPDIEHKVWESATRGDRRSHAVWSTALARRLADQVSGRG